MEQALTNLFITALGGLGVLLVTVMQVQANRFKHRLVKEQKAFDLKLADEERKRQAEINRLKAEIGQQQALTENIQAFAASNRELTQTVCQLVEASSKRDGLYAGEIRANSTAIGGLAESQGETRTTLERLTTEIRDMVAAMSRYLEEGATVRSAIEETRAAAQAARVAAEAALATLKERTL